MCHQGEFSVSHVHSALFWLRYQLWIISFRILLMYLKMSCIKCCANRFCVRFFFLRCHTSFRFCCWWWYAFSATEDWSFLTFIAVETWSSSLLFWLFLVYAFRDVFLVAPDLCEAKWIITINSACFWLDLGMNMAYTVRGYLFCLWWWWSLWSVGRHLFWLWWCWGFEESLFGPWYDEWTASVLKLSRDFIQVAPTWYIIHWVFAVCMWQKSGRFGGFVIIIFFFRS